MSLDDKTRQEILTSIATEGFSADENKAIRVIIAGKQHADKILTLSSGLPRIKGNLLHSFKLILSQPSALQAINPFEIRCTLCRNVISYPAWHFTQIFNVNHFHYFVCFDGSNPLKPTARCYKR